MIERRHDDDRDRIVDVSAGEHASDFEPVELRHPDVDEADVWTEPASQLDSCAAVAALADDLDAVGLEDQADTGTNNLLIVGNDDTKWFVAEWFVGEWLVVGEDRSRRRNLRTHRDREVGGDSPPTIRKWSGVERSTHRGRPLGHPANAEPTWRRRWLGRRRW